MKLFTLPATLTLPGILLFETSPRGNMKRFLWLTPILFVVMLGSAFADGITFVPNDGSGDNFGFFQNGAGFGGGVPYDFFNIGPYAPGSTLGGQADIFIEGGFIVIDGIGHDLAPLGPGTLFLSSLTLPTNGKDFRALVDLSFGATMLIIDTNEPVDVGGGAVGSIKFHFVDGFYYPDSAGFIQAPEPGTLGLMGSGLIGILALVRKRLRVSSMPAKDSLVIAALRLEGKAPADWWKTKASIGSLA